MCEERFAVIDDKLVWHGGVNLLGKEDVWDNLMRIKNIEVAAELLEIGFGGGEGSNKKAATNKPYIICHMMTSIDSRIDCAMTSQLKGVEDYYRTLDELDIPTTVSGRVTAELEMADPGVFELKDTTPYGQEGFSKKAEAKGYEVIVDTKGKLLWPDAKDMEKPYLIITSEQVTKEYLEYLDHQNISWIVCGKEKIDLVCAPEILKAEFLIDKMGIVGGPKINES